jgi:diguanylate cyclase (GGDEF)-like protein
LNKFSRSARVYILSTGLIGALLCLLQLPDVIGPRLLLFLGIAALGVLTNLFQTDGLVAGSTYNASIVAYSLALFALGRAEALWVVVIAHLALWVRRGRRLPWFAFVFNVGSLVIPVQLAEIAGRLASAGQWLQGLPGLAGILVTTATFVGLYHLALGLVHKLADGKSFADSGMFSPLLLFSDSVMAAMGATAALVWQINPYAAFLALSPLYMIHLALQLPALQRRAETDAKTGLFNARYFNQALERELGRAERFDRPLTVVMADLDLLRNINSAYGHLAGDAVIVGVAQLIRQSVRDYDVVARFGGEEFALCMPETTPEQAAPRVEALRAAIEAATFVVPGIADTLKASMSFGLAARQFAGQTATQIVHNADLALYQAKAAGRNRVCAFQAGRQFGAVTGSPEAVAGRASSV